MDKHERTGKDLRVRPLAVLAGLILLLPSDCAAAFEAGRALFRLERAIEHHGDMVRHAEDRSGIVQEDVEIRADRAGTVWRDATVGGFSDGLARSFRLHGVDLGGVVWTEAGVRGRLQLVHARGRFRSDTCIGRMLHHTPPEVKPVIGWTLGGMDWLRPVTQVFALAAAPVPDGWVVELELEDALPGTLTGGMSVRLTRDAQGWRRAYALTPAWNKAVHDVDASGLHVSADGVSGMLHVQLNPDRWVPPGLTRIPVAYAIEATNREGRLEGRFDAAGGANTYRGRLTGAALALLEGEYRSWYVPGPPGSTPDGVWTGRLEIGVVELHGDSADLARDKPDAAVGLQGCGDARFGPFFGETVALANGSNDTVHVPAVDTARVQEWRHIGRWRYGIERGVDPEMHTGEWPSAWHLPGAIAEQVLAGKSTAIRWMGGATIDSACDQDVWLAAPAGALNSVSVNGEKVWCGDDRSDGLDTAVFRARLRAGSNRVAWRAGVDGLEHGGHGSVQPNAAKRLQLARFGVCIAVRGAPARRPTEPTEQQSRGVDLASLEGPVAWNIRTGDGVRWSRPDLGGTAAPVVVGDNLLVAVEPNRLVCLDAMTGTTRWERRIGTNDASGNSARTASSSPVTDGTSVWVMFGNGAIACLAMDGGLVWQREDWTQWSGMHGPVLGMEGDVLAVEKDVLAEGEWRRRIERLDPKTGASIWTVTVATEPRSRRARATGQLDITRRGFGLLTLRAGADARTVIVTSSGQLVDAADGRILRTGLAGGEGESGHLAVEDDRVFFVAGGPDYVTGGWMAGWKSSAALWLEPDGRVGCRFLWRSKGPSRYGGVRPVVAQGRLYVYAVGTEHHMEYPCPWSGLHAYDPVSGQQVADMKPLLRDAVTPVALVRCGSRLYAVESGAPQPFLSHPQARIAVIELGEDPEGDLLVAENNIPPTDATPAIGAGVLFAMTLEGLFAFGDDGAEWKDHERDILEAARQRAMRPDAAPATDPMCPPPLPADGVPDDWPAAPLRHRETPERWQILGPMAAQPQPDPIAESLWGTTASEVRDRFADIPADRMVPAGVNFLRFGNEWYYRPNHGVEVLRLTGRRENSTTYLCAVLENDVQRVMRYACADAGVQAWLNGQPIRDGDPVEFRPGRYLLLLRVDIGRLPPFLNENTGRRLTACFEDAIGPAEWQATRRRLTARYGQGSTGGR